MVPNERFMTNGSKNDETIYHSDGSIFFSSSLGRHGITLNKSFMRLSHADDLFFDQIKKTNNSRSSKSDLPSFRKEAEKQKKTEKVRFD